MKAHLEYRDAKSAKFWEIAVEGSTPVVHHFMHHVSVSRWAPNDALS